MPVTFNTVSFSKQFDTISIPSDVKSVVPVIEYTKEYDDCSRDLYIVYTILASYFSVENVDETKIGKSYDNITEYINRYSVDLPLFKGSLSEYLKREIICVRKDHKIFGRIKNPSDILTITTDMLIIEECIDMLKRTQDNLKLQKIEKSRQMTLKKMNEILLDDDIDIEEKMLRKIWENTCDNVNCYNYKCCLNKQTTRKISYGASMLRCGSRTYASTVQIEHLQWIEKLIGILEQAIILSTQEKFVNSTKKEPTPIMLTV